MSYSIRYCIIYNVQNVYARTKKPEKIKKTIIYVGVATVTYIKFYILHRNKNKFIYNIYTYRGDRNF